MKNTDLMGVNEEGINKIVLNIYDYAERINTILNSADDAIREASKNFVINDEEILQKKFSTLTNNFIYVKDNILSYADELLKAKESYLRISEELSVDIKKAAEAVGNDNKYTEI